MRNLLHNKIFQTPKMNTSKAEHDALKTLSDNKDILVILTDTGNASVVTSGKDYKQKTYEHLSDRNYKLLTTDLNTAVERKATRMNKKSEIVDEVTKTLIPGNTVSMRLYK
jgi:hypothetical protein